MVGSKQDFYRVHSETPGPAVGPQHEPAHGGRGGGFIGRGHGGGFGRGEGFGHGHRPVTCYNCGVVGHYSRDFQSPTTTCNYCKSYDHTIEECLVLIAKMKEPKLVVNQNIKFIAAEWKEPERRVNIVTRSGVSTSGTLQDTKKNTGQEWVRKAPNKSTPLDLQKNKQIFQEAKTFFDDPMQSRLQVLPSRGILQQTPCGVSPVQMSQVTTSRRCNKD